MEPRPGAHVGEYVLHEPLGSGGFGHVWRARHRVWPERSVAVKFLHDPEQVAALHREARLMAGIEHPNITRALGVDLQADPPYLLMEDCPGESLRALLEREGPLPPARAAGLFAQLVSGLAQAHGQGIAHGDLKPENIIVGADDKLWITDFGLARARAQQMSLSLSMDLGSAQASPRLAGSLPYMAPEQRDGQQPDTATDVFTLGVLLFELLTGRRPQPGDALPAEGSLAVAFEGCYVTRSRRFASASDLAKLLKDQGRLPAEPKARTLPLPVKSPELAPCGPWSVPAEVEKRLQALEQNAGAARSLLLAVGTLVLVLATGGGLLLAESLSTEIWLVVAMIVAGGGLATWSSNSEHAHSLARKLDRLLARERGLRQRQLEVLRAREDLPRVRAAAEHIARDGGRYGWGQSTEALSGWRPWHPEPEPEAERTVVPERPAVPAQELAVVRVEETQTPVPSDQPKEREEAVSTPTPAPPARQQVSERPPLEQLLEEDAGKAGGASRRPLLE